MRGDGRPRWALALVALFAAATAASAALSIVALTAPEGSVARTVVLSPVDELRATDCLNAGADPRSLTCAEAAAHRTLTQSPTRAVAWLDLAYSDTLRRGALTPAGLEDLRRSYLFEPLGPDVSDWRVQFLLEHWDEAPPDLRQDTQDELKALWGGAHQAVLRSELKSVRNPAGRLAAGLLIPTLDRLSKT